MCIGATETVIVSGCGVAAASAIAKTSAIMVLRLRAARVPDAIAVILPSRITGEPFTKTCAIPSAAT